MIKKTKKKNIDNIDNHNNFRLQWHKQQHESFTIIRATMLQWKKWQVQLPPSEEQIAASALVKALEQCLQNQSE